VTRLKKLFLWCSKLCGLFAVARAVTGGRLRILCYHGVALEDEDAFRPKLFIRPDTLERRLRYLKSMAFPVLPLDSAVERLRYGDLPRCAVALTADDGFYSTYSIMGRLARRLELPFTLYVTSYYVVHQAPIFRLALQYMFWRTTESSLEVCGLGGDLCGARSLETKDERDRTMWELIDFGERKLDENERQALARRVGERLAVDYDHLAEKRKVSLMTPDEIREFAATVGDIGLHTHRHVLPEEEAGAIRELDENRAVLEPIVDRTLKHFCYPSGEWSQAHWPALERAGIGTATTCEAGLNHSETPPFRLRRFLDGENISQIEFESEMSGYTELLRRLRSFATATATEARS
jgi:peptidoglycan/xylan/chitin deacetylase (PgdA/CDA1 family)